MHSCPGQYWDQLCVEGAVCRLQQPAAGGLGETAVRAERGARFRAPRPGTVLHHEQNENVAAQGGGGRREGGGRGGEWRGDSCFTTAGSSDNYSSIIL